MHVGAMLHGRRLSFAYTAQLARWLEETELSEIENAAVPGDAERRQNPEVRTIFVEAYELLEPFFDPQNRWAGHTHEHLAFRALHERFPLISAQQAQILVEAARRVFAGGGAPGPA